MKRLLIPVVFGSMTLTSGGTILCFLILAAPAASQDAVVTRLAGASFTVADIAKARQFYTELLGFEEAFDLKDASGKPNSAFFKVNDDQYLEFSPGEVEGFRLDRVMLLSPDLQKARTALTKPGIATGETTKAADGTEYFTVRDPDRMEIRFVSYLPGSRQAELTGKHLGDRRISLHLHHVALAADHEAASMALFKEALAMPEFSRGPKPDDLRWINLSVPGSSGDVLEFMVTATQPPPARQHIGFEVLNIQETFKQLTDRGFKQQNRPFPAAIGRWIWFIRDPNSFRIEFMGQPTDKQEGK
jgi:catechol 2,3-dioxygenase-like lactoylglutathione lyase family enzyme